MELTTGNATIFLGILSIQDGHEFDYLPDFGSILNENARNPNCKSAIDAGTQRGNKKRYGRIPIYRYCERGERYYLQSELDEWFYRVMNRDLINRRDLWRRRLSA